MTIPVSDEGGNPTGHAWLRRELNLAVPPPAVESYVAARACQTRLQPVRRDLTEELAFVAVFDRACAAVREIVDMPDRRVALFVRLCMQNSGRLSAKKRRFFAELENVEVDAMQASIGDALADATSGP